jgi:hypothetical protein
MHKKTLQNISTLEIKKGHHLFSLKGQNNSSEDLSKVKVVEPIKTVRDTIPRQLRFSGSLSPPPHSSSSWNNQFPTLAGQKKGFLRPAKTPKDSSSVSGPNQ